MTKYKIVFNSSDYRTSDDKSGAIKYAKNLSKTQNIDVSVFEYLEDVETGETLQGDNPIFQIKKVNKYCESCNGLLSYYDEFNGTGHCEYCWGDRPSLSERSNAKTQAMHSELDDVE